VSEIDHDKTIADLNHIEPI
jgi:hypothetical protein